MIKTVSALAAFGLLAACSGKPEAQPTEAATQAPAPVATPSLPAPGQEIFSKLYADACPSDKPVNTAACKRAGFGSEDVLCEFGLGDDEYLRNEATLTPGDGEWTLADPENVCVG